MAVDPGAGCSCVTQIECFHRSLRLGSRYIPKELISEASGRLRKKILFGSDYPYISPVTWLEQFQELDIRDGLVHLYFMTMLPES
ncbi:MAG: hypothetical protein Ct9H300mP19_06890 [Dehalococcoidia bacterium]|nr:MAG: hypothetical protein Ct9H300mP19_06890 [Dehalococcoidia bacterium]